MYSRYFWILTLLLVMVGLNTNTVAAGDWRFPVGLSYISNFSEIVDIYEDNLEEEGYIVDTTEGVPVGVSFQPYYAFENGFGVGFGIGPLMYIDVDDEADFFDIPLGIDGRYLFLSNSSVAPYLRAGIRAHMASGEYVEGSSPGLFGGAGIEFLRGKRVNLGFEVLYDSSSIELERLDEDDTKDVQPGQVTISFFVIF